METICASFPDWTASYYRRASGAELDLVLERGSRRFVFDCRATYTPTASKAFLSTLDEIPCEHSYVVSLIESVYELAPGVSAIGLRECMVLFRGRIKSELKY